MPVMGPSENPFEVDKVYEEIMALLRDKYKLQTVSPNIIGFLDYSKEREERNAKFKEALRLLFQLEAWECW